MEHFIKDDIAGRLRNTPLPYSHALLPLFEAVVNSIQSIEDLESYKTGKIDIYISRGTQNNSIDELSGSKTYNPIDGYLITDNGLGFTETNFDSFKTADSRLKEKKGGKGVGRFIWLKAFSSVSIDSMFINNNVIERRKFEFLPKGTGIHSHIVEPSNDKDVRTIVELKGLKKKYQSKTPVQTETIAQGIIDHCVVYLLSKNCPQINVFDREAETFININNTLLKEIALDRKDVVFEIDDLEFTSTFIYLNSEFKGDHKVSLCADNREVKGISVKKLIPDLTGKKLPISDVETGTMLVLVSSVYLNKSVNQERTDFLFSRNNENETDDAYDISEKKLLSKVTEVIREEVQDFLESIKDQKIRRIEEFVEKEEPEYRVLLKHAKEEIESLPANLDDHKLDTELHKILHSVELQLKEEGRTFINEDLAVSLNNPEYKEKYDGYVSKLLDLRQSELSKYVLHRKTIIDILGSLLQRKSDGKYSLEDEIHKLLYPMRTSSYDAEFGQQNLWLIDEKLTYHYFLASDLEFNKMDKIAVNSNDRPDVIIVDRPSSFVEGDYPHHSVVIIELKRPQRKNYSSKEKDPFDQVYGYMEDLIDGKIIGEDGAHVEVGKDTRFYCYIVADVTQKIKQKARRSGFKETIDGGGYYDFNETYNAYIEIISYRKLYEDAKKRNKVLFDKLGLPVR